MSLVAEAVEPSTVSDDQSDTVAVMIENHETGMFTRLVPIPTKDYAKTLKKIRVAALTRGFGVRVEDRTVEGDNTVAVLSLGTPQTRARKPKEAPTADKAPAAPKAPKGDAAPVEA